MIFQERTFAYKMLSFAQDALTFLLVLTVLIAAVVWRPAGEADNTKIDGLSMDIWWAPTAHRAVLLIQHTYLALLHPRSTASILIEQVSGLVVGWSVDRMVRWSGGRVVEWSRGRWSSPDGRGCLPKKPPPAPFSHPLLSPPLPVTHPPVPPPPSPPLPLPLPLPPPAQFLTGALWLQIRSLVVRTLENLTSRNDIVIGVMVAGVTVCATSVILHKQEEKLRYVEFASGG